jgi:hypothetical protein
MTSAPLAPRFLLLAACLVAGAFVVSSPLEARAQEAPADSAAMAEPMAPADSAAISAAMAASDSALAEAKSPGRAARSGANSRFEFGAAMPKGYFDWLGTVGYRHRVLTDMRFEHWLQAEATFGKKDYLSEGSASVAWFIRPLVFWRPGWRIRPVVEGGISGTIVVQFADIEGFNDWSSHARGYVKSHLVGGLETDLSGRWGIALRGRFTIPASRPLDYAQVVLFLR